MKNIIAAAILALALILAVYLYTERTRYAVVTGEKVGFMIDRVSGRAWCLLPGSAEQIKQ